MNFIKYLFLAIIQGFTEPIPISSSGHLVIIKNLINNANLDNLNLEIILNFGSLIAILIYFRKEIIDIIKDFFKYFKDKDKKSKVNAKYVLYIIIATIPAGIVGVLLKDKVELISQNLNFI